MGLSRVLARAPGRVVAGRRIWIDGEQLFRIPEPVAELGERAVRTVFPAALLDRILAEAARQPNFAYHPATRFADVIRARTRRATGVRAVAGATVLGWPADLVVDCDGRGSSVRTHAKLTLAPTPETYEVPWFKMQSPAENAGDFRIIIRGGQHPLIAYTSWDEQLQRKVIMPQGAWPSSRGRLARSRGSRSARGACPCPSARGLRFHPAQRAGGHRAALDRAGCSAARGRRPPDVPGSRPGHQPRAARRPRRREPPRPSGRRPR
jgi:2-polyprenyl-6-methoxyphenol hydroxylase-like FAD-dependent oxidoreductase